MAEETGSTLISDLLQLKKTLSDCNSKVDLLQSSSSSSAPQQNRPALRSFVQKLDKRLTAKQKRVRFREQNQVKIFEDFDNVEEEETKVEFYVGSDDEVIQIVDLYEDFEDQNLILTEPLPDKKLEEIVKTTAEGDHGITQIVDFYDDFEDEENNVEEEENNIKEEENIIEEEENNIEEEENIIEEEAVSVKEDHEVTQNMDCYEDFEDSNLIATEAQPHEKNEELNLNYKNVLQNQNGSSLETKNETTEDYNLTNEIVLKNGDNNSSLNDNPKNKQLKKKERNVRLVTPNKRSSNRKIIKRKYVSYHQHTWGSWPKNVTYFISVCFGVLLLQISFAFTLITLQSSVQIRSINNYVF